MGDIGPPYWCKCCEKTVARLNICEKCGDRIKQLEAENSILNESISEYNKAVNALQKTQEELEAAIGKAIKFIGGHQHSKTICKAISILQKALEGKD